MLSNKIVFFSGLLLAVIYGYGSVWGLGINWMIIWGAGALTGLWFMAIENPARPPKDMGIFGHEEGFRTGEGPAKV